MKLLFLGSGSGLGSLKNNYQSNVALISHDNKILGIDCGTTFQLAIEKANLELAQFTAFYITHIHTDHVGGLEWVGFSKYFTQPIGCNRPLLFGNAEILEELWEHTLSGGMRSLQGSQNTLETFFNTRPLSPVGRFEWEYIEFLLIPTVHVIDNRRIVPSFGLIFNINGTTIFFTGDSQFDLRLVPIYEKVDIIFQDCELMAYPSSVHAQFHQLCTLPLEIRNKMWLYHFGGKYKDVCKLGKQHGFLGFVQKGQEFNF